jgi:DNA-binding transcriptional LysR family regulator
MNLRQLEYFIAIADEGSFRAAAERVRVAPPSLSQQIRVLETELGGPLFERLARGSRLTPAGRAFLPEARSAVLAAQRGSRAARAALALEQAELEVATVLSLAVGLLPGPIERLNLAYPGIAVRLHEYLHRDALVRAVDDGVGDIAVGPAPPARSGPVVELGPEAFVAIVGPRHPAFSSQRPVRIGALADDDWILFPTWHGLHGLVTAICAHAGFVPRDAITTAQVEAAVRLAAGGLGVAIVPANIVPPHLRRHVRTLDPPVFRVLYAYTRAEWSPQAEALLRALEQEPWPETPRNALVLD